MSAAANSSSDFDEFEVQTSAGLLRGGPRGVVRVNLKPGAHLNVVHIQELHTRYRELVTSPRPVLIDTRRLASMTQDARKLAAGKGIATLTLRLAILIESRVSAVIASFFTRLSRPGYPTRVFADEQDALRWLSAPKR